ncbi:MAG: hypothetical protein QM779_17515 [Propionicimonas sp.]|uniref:hypothetical protein n=1 Tax=Propionicimonas sp. TaxID=1955623 RepID=UPI003D0ED1CA
MTLIVEVDAIRTMGNDLKSVAAEFDGANANSDAIADAVGHPGLADTVRDFAHGWDDTRGKMVDAMNALGDAAITVADNWVDLDQQGADALTSTGQQPPGSNSPRAE